ncbi:hypothetical protein TNCV_4418431 [Trichonephila clavipes]|nr:hypothetical protein TNCV_4418431 [Trichonephila clavipes]
MLNSKIRSKGNQIGYLLTNLKKKKMKHVAEHDLASDVQDAWSPASGNCKQLARGSVSSVSLSRYLAKLFLDRTR